MVALTEFGDSAGYCLCFNTGEHIQQTHTTGVQHHGPYRPQTLVLWSKENLPFKEVVPLQAKATQSTFSSSICSSWEQKEEEDPVYNWTLPEVLVAWPLGK